MGSEFSLDYQFAVASPEDVHRARTMSDMLENSPNPMQFECHQNDSPYSGLLKVRACGNIGVMECRVDAPAGSNTLFVSERARSHIARSHFQEFQVCIWAGDDAMLDMGGRTQNLRAGNFITMSFLQNS